MVRLGLLCIALLAGCLRSTNFQCDNDPECGADGKCEATGYCSFADSSCAGLGDRRYGDHSGPSSGQCTGSVVPGEGGGMEAGMEMPSGCPGNYTTLPSSGSRMHRYRKLNNDRIWVTARDECAANGTFLAFPDGPEAAMELAALRTFSNDNTWVGVNDILAEGTYRNSFNQIISAQTQALLSTPGGGQSNDCFLIANTTIEHADCAVARPAVCECVP